MQKNGKSKAPLTVIEQFGLAWSAGMRRQEAWITSPINLQARSEGESCVQWWLFPEFKPSPDFSEYRFPLARGRSWKLGLISLLRFFLFLRASLRLLQLRLSQSPCCAGQRRSSVRPRRNVVRQQSSGGCGNRRTNFERPRLTTIGPELPQDEPELELAQTRSKTDEKLA